MRSAAIFIVSVAFLTSVGLSGAALPITMVSGNAPPATAPAPPIGVMLLPFHPVGQSAGAVWVSEAIDEDLAHDLSRNSAIRVIRPATTQPMTASDGLDASRQANAQQLVSGSYQVVDDQLRVTGDVIDVNLNKSVGQIKATGHLRDLFQLEDALATQLWHILPRPEEDALASDIQVTPLEDESNGQQSTASEIAPPQQSAVSQGPVVYDSAPDALDYPYASYGYGYGFGYPVFIFGGYGHGTYDHGGGHRGVYIHGGTRSTGSANFASPHTVEPHFAPTEAGGHFVGGHR